MFIHRTLFIHSALFIHRTMSSRLPVDWPSTAEPPPDTLDADPARRMGWLAIWFTLPLFAVALRLADLQGRLQPLFLEVFAQTRTVEEDLPARNGRILGSDGAVLADDVTSYDLLVHYRWLEEPPDPQWLRRQAWSRLSRTERRQSALVAHEMMQAQARQHRLWDELSLVTGIPAAELDQRRQAIQDRVEEILWAVEQRRAEQHAASATSATPLPSARPNAAWAEWLLHLWRQFEAALTQPPARSDHEPLVIREQETFHLVVAGVSAEVATEIEAHPERYPGVKIAVRTQRIYPQGELAAHLVGSRVAAAEGPRVSTGRGGLERQYDHLLSGRRGRKRTVMNRHGEVLSTNIVSPAQHGRDIVLTLDLPLQRRAEQLLDAALRRRPPAEAADDEPPRSGPASPELPQGGCIVALDVHTGAVLVAASAPRFDANLLVAPDPERWQAALSDPRKPFFPRATQMALAPGSVFKVVAAVALLESGVYDPHSSIFCRGFLDRPDQHRCLTFRHYGYGHGPVDLGDALCRSCNVYFFQGVRRAGADVLVDWAQRLGIGRPTGIDVPGETGGRLPSPGANGGRRWYAGDTLGLAIGQSSLTVTPLQVARLMAAIANDGELVTPHLVASAGPVAISAATAVLETRPQFAHPEPVPISGLHQNTLAAIRAGLHRVVHDPEGTGYHSVRLADVPIAGKTGTAEVGGGLPDHAWFAGYLPADQPRIALVVVLEHGGSGSRAAGPLARELAQAMVEAGVISGNNAVTARESAVSGR
uniref:Penicillin-binding protein 2 n=1 Tax=Schlesneria paludicola TaxID=360056 RepID=A0A7C4LNB4_9PLAN